MPNSPERERVEMKRERDARQRKPQKISIWETQRVKDGKLNLNMNDEIVRDTLLTQSAV